MVRIGCCVPQMKTSWLHNICHLLAWNLILNCVFLRNIRNFTKTPCSCSYSSHPSCCQKKCGFYSRCLHSTISHYRRLQAPWYSIAASEKVGSCMCYHVSLLSVFKIMLVQEKCLSSFAWVEQRNLQCCIGHAVLLCLELCCMVSSYSTLTVFSWQASYDLNVEVNCCCWLRKIQLKMMPVYTVKCFSLCHGFSNDIHKPEESLVLKLS